MISDDGIPWQAALPRTEHPGPELPGPWKPFPGGCLPSAKSRPKLFPVPSDYSPRAISSSQSARSRAVWPRTWSTPIGVSQLPWRLIQGARGPWECRLATLMACLVVRSVAVRVASSRLPTEYHPCFGENSKLKPRWHLHGSWYLLRGFSPWYRFIARKRATSTQNGRLVGD